VTAALRLDATYTPGQGDGGTLLVRLVNAGPVRLSEFRLAITCVVPLTPPDGGATRLVTRTSGYHELAPPIGFELAPGQVWRLEPLACGHSLRHANDGPASAFLIAVDGSTRPVHVGATARADVLRIGR
jgi:hexosaminidase